MRSRRACFDKVLAHCKDEPDGGDARANEETRLRFEPGPTESGDHSFLMLRTISNICSSMNKETG